MIDNSLYCLYNKISNLNKRVLKLAESRGKIWYIRAENAELEEVNSMPFTVARKGKDR